MATTDEAARQRADRAEAEFNAFQRSAEQGEQPAELEFHDALTEAGQMVELAASLNLSTEAGAVQLSIAQAAEPGEAGFAALEQAIDQLEAFQTAAGSAGASPELAALTQRLWNCLYREKARRLPEHSIAESLGNIQAASGNPGTGIDGQPGGVQSAAHRQEVAAHAAAIAEAAANAQTAGQPQSPALDRAAQVWGEAGVLSTTATELNYFTPEVQAQLQRDVSEAIRAKFASLNPGETVVDQAANIFSGPMLEKVAKLMSTHGEPVTPDIAGRASLETIARMVGFEIPADYRTKLVRNDSTDGLALSA